MSRAGLSPLGPESVLVLRGSCTGFNPELCGPWEPIWGVGFGHLGNSSGSGGPLFVGGRIHYYYYSGPRSKKPFGPGPEGQGPTGVKRGVPGGSKYVGLHPKLGRGG